MDRLSDEKPRGYHDKTKAVIAGMPATLEPWGMWHILTALDAAYDEIDKLCARVVVPVSVREWAMQHCNDDKWHHQRGPQTQPECDVADFIISLGTGLASSDAEGKG